MKKQLPQGLEYKTIIRNSKQYKIVSKSEEFKKRELELGLHKSYLNRGFKEEHYNYIVDTKNPNYIRLSNYISKIKEPPVQSSILWLYGPDNSIILEQFYNWIGKSILASGVTCECISMSELCKKAYHSSTWDKAQRNETDIEFYEECDILIITRAFSELVQWNTYLNSFISNRISGNKGIIFVSNIPSSNISKNYNLELKELIRANLFKRNSEFIFGDNQVPEVLF